MRLPRQCAILVGGLGTRLGALTRDTPKPLLDCGGRPFLGWIIRELTRYGIEEILLLTGYKAESFEGFVAEMQAWLPKKVTLKLSREPAPAGTGGAVWHARDLLEETFLLLNGDSWIDANLSRLFVEANPHAIGQIALRREPNPGRFGVVKLDDQMNITGIMKRDTGEQPAIINAGIYLFSKELLQLLSPSCSIEEDIFPVLASKRLLSGRLLEGYFIDIGIPSDYQTSQTEIPKRMMRPAVFFDRDGVLNHDLGWVGFRKNFRWTDTAKEAVRAVNDAGYHAFIVTNQAGVARGFYSEDDVHALHGWLIEELRKEGANIDDISYCPHHRDATVARYKADCRRRKPEPGMIDDLCTRWHVDKNRSFLIGDKASDIEAASRAGIEGRFFNGDDLCSLVKTCLTNNT
ncbi:HAD-IIIA family hydrolase [Bradyrhizobium sp. USDA 4486]